MLSKIMMGGLAATLLALGVVFSMLLSAKEANGVLVQGIESARGINERQKSAMTAVLLSKEKLLRDFERERRKANVATAALEASNNLLTQTTADFERRLGVALEGLDDEELVCAFEPVPDGLIVGLWDDEAGSPD